MVLKPVSNAAPEISKPLNSSPNTFQPNTNSDTRSSLLVYNDNSNNSPELPSFQKLWPIIACGAGLFSDGYLNGIIGSVNTMLLRIYGDQYKSSPAQTVLPSIAFVGTVVGMLVFGHLSDHYSRKWSLIIATVIITVFAALCAGSYGAHGSTSGMLIALTIYRFFLGIGIGGEYPAGSVSCAENSGELDTKTRNRWFIMFTNVQIDFGLLVSSIIPMIVVLAVGEDHLRIAWRLCLAFGVFPPLILLIMRFKLREPEVFQREAMVGTKTPWLLCIKYYWKRLLIVSLIWFVYDFSAYSFGIYSSSILDNLLRAPADAVGVAGASNRPSTLWKAFGWNTLITFFYMPGCILGSFLADIPCLGPRRTLGYAAVAQGLVGFIMAGCYKWLSLPSNIGAFVVLYGIFLGLGDVGPGDNIGLIASTTCATSVRGQYYGIAAAIGKIGAFAGSYAFPVMQRRAKSQLRAGQDPFFVGSALTIISGLFALWLLPSKCTDVNQNVIVDEDNSFRDYLKSAGWNTDTLGIKPTSPRVEGSASDVNVA